jgi:hypothetical protein
VDLDSKFVDGYVGKHVFDFVMVVIQLFLPAPIAESVQSKIWWSCSCLEGESFHIHLGLRGHP